MSGRCSVTAAWPRGPEFLGEEVESCVADVQNLVASEIRRSSKRQPARDVIRRSAMMRSASSSQRRIRTAKEVLWRSPPWLWGALGGFFLLLGMRGRVGYFSSDLFGLVFFPEAPSIRFCLPLPSRLSPE